MEGEIGSSGLRTGTRTRQDAKCYDISTRCIHTRVARARLLRKWYHLGDGNVDSVWNTFSPMMGFRANLTLIATMCNPKWHVDSYDLSGAYVGNRLDDRAV